MNQRVVTIGALALVLCGLLAGPAPARVDDGDWKRIQTNFQRMWPTDKPGAVSTLGEADRIESVRMLVKLLGWQDGASGRQTAERNQLMDRTDQFLKTAAKSGYRVTLGEKQRFDKMQSRLRELEQQITAGNFVRFAAITALARTRDAAALDYLHQTGLRHSRWEVRSGVLIALGQAGHQSSKPFVRGKIADSDPLVASSAIDAAGALADREAVPDVVKALKTRYWQVRAAAATVLGRFKSLDAVGPLVEALQQEEGRMQQDLDEALQRITGYTFGGNPAAWKSWFAANRERLAEVVNARATQRAAKGKREGRTSTFYGIEIRSNRICFILDISGSMSQKAGRPGGGTTLSGDGANPDKYPVDGTKLDVAKYELKQAVRSLSKKTYFNIVTFNHNLTIYSPRSMVAASPSNKTRARGWIEQLKPDGATNIFDALDQGFKLSGPSLKSNYRTGVDTIYFLTDGVPTHGRIRDTAKILTELGMRNKLRKIKLHVIGVGKRGELDLDFLRKLAEQNGGTFVHRD